MARRWTLLALLLPGVLAAAGGDDAQTLDRAIAELERRQQALQSERGQVHEELARLEEAMGRLAGRLRELAQQDRRLRSQAAELEEARKERRAELAELRRQLAELIRAAYLAGREERLKLLLNQEDPALVGRMLAYHDYLARERSEKIEASRRLLAEIEALSEEIEAKRRRLERLTAEVGEQRRQLAERNEARQALLARIDAQLKAAGERLRQMREDRRRLARVIEASAQALRALEPPGGIAFAKRRGKLRWPLEGRLGARFGTEKIADLRWDGVIIWAPEGREVKAVHPGRVAYADWLRGYGLLLIIDHGDGYMTLYGHNQALLKELGDWVTEGEVIGLAGRSGGLRRAGIYFGIRHQGKAVDPARWCRRGKGRRVG